MQSYHPGTIIIITLILYFTSWILVKFNKMKKMNQRKIWNIALTVTFLISAILGLVLAIQIENKMTNSWFTAFLWWHVEAGIAMTIIAIMHLIWHINYYKIIGKDLFANKKI
jgi:cytochrome bd-type quinol oxidase subunit 2